MWTTFSFVAFFITYSTYSISINDLNIPPEHVKYVINSFPSLAETCKHDPLCPYKESIGKQICWGYERLCNQNFSYHVRPNCPGDHRGWVKSKDAQVDTFYTQADFGYVKEQINELMVICEASYPDDTSLECSKYLRFCRGRNVMLNFTGLVGRGDNLRYKMDILGLGEIGGYCNFYSERLKREAEHMSALQSWGPELVNFVKTSEKPIPDGKCDIVVQKPTYIMKLDATVNMYHHFCDFFNLYASLHVNSTHPSMFSKDNHVLIWETFTYDSAFKDTFKAFTKNPIWDLKKFRGKVVCFKNVVFPLLPRMIFGLYYNTPLVNIDEPDEDVTLTLLAAPRTPHTTSPIPSSPVMAIASPSPTLVPNILLEPLSQLNRPQLYKPIYGCERSGLFHAFSKHIIHSLNIKLQPRNTDKVRVTLLSRGTTYRSIMNENEIIDALSKEPGYQVQRVVFDRTIPFTKQLEITHNSDVFIGMHGAGLTHLLFLPDWAAVFEVYNCEDPNCYLDLTRLRGLKYVTWEDNTKLVQQDQGHGPGGGSHAKFTNYSFDVKEFLRLVENCADYVRKRQDFQNFIESSTIHRPHGEL